MTVPNKPLIIGTRGSALAMWQTRAVAAQLTVPAEIQVIETAGDRFLSIALQGQQEKGFFTKEIEDQLLAGAIDLAVHSLKDLPTTLPDGLTVAAYLPRAAVSDLLLVHPDWHEPANLLPVRDGGRVGATSLRRQALLRLYAPRTEPAFLRGNVPTRVRKCVDGEYGAIILARAGIERLQADLTELLVYELNPQIWLPAPGQGAIAVQARANDHQTLAAVQPLDHETTRKAVSIERHLLARFEGGCHTAFGSLATQQPAGDWQVITGLEDAAAGWGHCVFQGSLTQCRQLSPADLTAFAPRSVHHQEELCRPLPR
ncbi:MAG: hydroxymethylbilane synthase [Acidobacteria bacterium]|nr:hydroxymethylbilane synthase [Acidobacteriota bacterium]